MHQYLLKSLAERRIKRWGWAGEGCGLKRVVL